VIIDTNTVLPDIGRGKEELKNRTILRQEYRLHAGALTGSAVYCLWRNDDATYHAPETSQMCASLNFECLVEVWAQTQTKDIIFQPQVEKLCFFWSVRILILEFPAGKIVYWPGERYTILSYSLRKRQIESLARRKLGKAETWQGCYWGHLPESSLQIPHESEHSFSLWGDRSGANSFLFFANSSHISQVLENALHRVEFAAENISHDTFKKRITPALQSSHWYIVYFCTWISTVLGGSFHALVFNVLFSSSLSLFCRYFSRKNIRHENKRQRNTK